MNSGCHGPQTILNIGEYDKVPVHPKGQGWASASHAAVYASRKLVRQRHAHQPLNGEDVRCPGATGG
jgi:hypothetical protein